MKYLKQFEAFEGSYYKEILAHISLSNVKSKS